MSTRGFKLGGDDGPFPGHIYIADIARLTKITRVTKVPLTSSLGPSDWSPDGRSLLLSRKTESGIKVFRLDIASGEETQLTGRTNESQALTTNQRPRQSVTTIRQLFRTTGVALPSIQKRIPVRTSSSAASAATVAKPS